MTMATTRLANPPQKTLPRRPAAAPERAAVIAAIVAVVSQPMLHPTGPGNSSPVDLLIVAAIVTAMVWLAGTHRKLRAPYVIPAGLFIAAGAASGLVSPLPTTALVTVAIDILLFGVVHDGGQRPGRATGHALRARGLELVRHRLGGDLRRRVARSCHAARRAELGFGQPAVVHLR